MTGHPENSKESWAADFLSSLVVFLVALPLCLGIALASGVPPVTGIISGIIGGLIVGGLAGCPLQVSGPAAGLITIVVDIVGRHGISGLGVILIGAGAIQIAFGAAGLARSFRSVSPAVIKGMLSGIGVVIFASQFHVMIDDSPAGSALVNLATIPKAIVKAVTLGGDSAHPQAALVGVLTIVTILLWGWKPPRLLRAVPPSLAGVAVAIAAANALAMPIRFIQIPEALGSALSFPSLEGLAGLLTPSLFGAALTVAFVASAETLLTATAVDQMTGRTKTNYDREIMAQGTGQLIAGVLGCPPITGVIVRSATNVQAGARSRASTMLHGFWLLLFLTAMPGLLTYVPVSSLAAILVFTGVKLVNPAAIRHLWEIDKGEAAVFLVTVATIVASNLLNGIIAGLGAATILLLYRISRLQCQKEVPEGEYDEAFVLSGTASFMNLAKLDRLLEMVPPRRNVRIRIELAYIDHAAQQLLSDWCEDYRRRGGEVRIESPADVRETVVPAVSQ